MVATEDDFTLRRPVTAEAQARILIAQAKLTQAEDGFRQAVLSAVDDGASVREVAKASGLSANTIQRWKDQRRERRRNNNEQRNQ